MDFKITFVILLLVACTLDNINARRVSSGSSRSSSSSSRSGGSGSRYGSSSSRGTGSSSGHGSSFGTSHGTGSNTGSRFGTGHGTASNTGHGSGSGFGQGTGSSRHDINTDFLNSQGGGARRPAGTGSVTSSPISRATVPPLSHTAPTRPPWSNPYYNPPSTPRPFPQNPATYAPFPPHPTPGNLHPFPTYRTTPRPYSPYPTAPHRHHPNITGPHSGQPFPPSAPTAKPFPPLGSGHPNPPYPTVSPFGIPQNRNPNPPYPTFFPTNGHNPPYPTQPPFGVSQHGNPSYSIPHPVPYPVPQAHPPGWKPMGTNPVSTPGNPPYPRDNWHSGNPFENPHSVRVSSMSNAPAGSPYSTPMYRPPEVFAQPAAQPYVPGNTVIMIPSQPQSSGPGFGSMLGQALMFSVVNAGVNRIINPYPHYGGSRPAENGNSSPVIINNIIPGSPQGTGTQPGTVNSGQTGSMGSSFPASGTQPGLNSQPGTPFSGTNSQPGTPFPGTNPQPGTSFPGSDTQFGGASVGQGAHSGSAFPASQGSNPPVQTGSASNIPSPSGSGFGTAGAAGAAGAAGNSGTQNTGQSGVNGVQYRISDDDLMKITEELFKKEEYNMSKYITLNLQKRMNETVNITDEARGPFIFVDPAAYEIPTIRAIRTLYDNYEENSLLKENVTLEARKEQNLFLDVLLNTNVMSAAMQWLANNRFIDPDDFERKDILQRIWFSRFDGSSSGFERIFASEMYGDPKNYTAVLGVQDWIYFDYLESQKRIDYMGYADQLNLGNNTSLLKINFEKNGVIRPHAPVFIGTTPELEMAIYTICFYARPNNMCPVSLGGVRFYIYTHTFRYYGKDLIDLALPVF